MSEPERESLTRRSGPAEVRAVQSKRRLQIGWDGAAGTFEADVIVPGYEPRIGDRVLAFVDDGGAAYVLGVLRVAPQTRLQEAAERPETKRVVDKRGELLFEYDPLTDRATLHVPSGDLDLRVPGGALRIEARDGVAVKSESTLHLESRRAVELVAGRGDERVARVALQPGEVSLMADVLTAAASRAELLASRVGMKARHVETSVQRAIHVARVIEVRAERIVERAKDAYREIEGLSQTRAGRLRLVAKKTAQLVGESTLVKARDRMKIKGERIHLA